LPGGARVRAADNSGEYTRLRDSGEYTRLRDIVLADGTLAPVETDEDDNLGCEGHESLSGLGCEGHESLSGRTYTFTLCDGSCRGV
jgi:hypothetical protein